MKVGYLINNYPAPSHTFIRREILALEERGVDVHRFTIRSESSPLSDPADIEEAKLTTSILQGKLIELLISAFVVILSRPMKMLRTARLANRLSSNSSRGIFVHLAYLVEACELLRLTTRAGIRHIHAHFGTNSAAVAVLWKSLGGGTFSFTVHGSSELTRPDEISLALKILHADFVVAISKHCRSQLYRWCALDSWPKIQIVHCGLSRAFLEETPRPIPDSNRFFYAGRFSALKGLPILLEAAKTLNTQGEEFEIVLAGDGPLRQTLEDRVKKEGLQDCVKFVGWLSDDQVKTYLETSKAMVLPSFAEGLPVSIMEALARGRPVIASRIAAIPELVEDGKSGWTVSPGDAEELATAMRQLIQTPLVILESMGLAGRSAVLQRHDIQTSAEHLEQLFGDMTG